MASVNNAAKLPPIEPIAPEDPKLRLLKQIDKLRAEGKVIKKDVLIVGSGPIGAVYARTFKDANAGLKVIMIDMGSQGSFTIGDHHKNSVAVQKDINLFTNVIRGQLSPLSVPAGTNTLTLPPGAWSTDSKFVLNGLNPCQSLKSNLAASAATRLVGGMSTHWTCCTPRQHPRERSELFTDDEWDELYSACERLFYTNGAKAKFDDSVRQRLVKKALEDYFADQASGGATPREVRTMPLAAQPGGKNSQYVKWSCTSTILGSLADLCTKDPEFEFKSQWQCESLYIDTGKDAESGTVQAAIVTDLVNNESWLVEAKKYVVCGGTVLTAGILAKACFQSGLDLKTFTPALGKYLTEQPMTFCQIILSQKLVERVETNPSFLDDEGSTIIRDRVRGYREKHPDDPVPFPYGDPDPNVYTPFSDDFPWHTQIHRDAFGYGELPAGLDQRLVVDLRFFGYVDTVETNKITWDRDRKDGFGMPQPTFHFEMSRDDCDRASDMMQDMVDVASTLGPFVPGAEPKYLAPGLALHICGIYRAGQKLTRELGFRNVKKTSVVNREGLVWGLENLYLGGCGILPKGNASNPTLTAACHALASARVIISDLQGK
ncbi:hypothetical protein GGR57DRAFT_513365 [Xylariaceae sp. FL1272]|nr:hypothetical protein GGR57DRAFT_513365 [Xylariaceae sp. FL1272]